MNEIRWYGWTLMFLQFLKLPAASSEGYHAVSLGTKLAFIPVFYIFVQFARFTMFAVASPVLRRWVEWIVYASIYIELFCFSLLSQYTWKEYVLLAFAGLRGGVCLLTAMQIEQDGGMAVEEARIASKNLIICSVHRFLLALYIASCTFLILLINGTGFKPLYKYLQPYQPNPFRSVYLSRVMMLVRY